MFAEFERLPTEQEIDERAAFTGMPRYLVELQLRVEYMTGLPPGYESWAEYLGGTPTQ